MLFPNRPWRLALGFALFLALTAWPLLSARNWPALALLCGYMVTQCLFVGLKSNRLLSWSMGGVSLLFLLLVLATTGGLTDSLTPVALYTLGVIGVRLPRRWVIPVGWPLSMLMYWGTKHFGPVSVVGVVFDSLGLLSVLLLGHVIATLRRSRDESQALAAQLQEANTALRARAVQDAEYSRLHERERLARELHDTLGHALSTLTVQLEAARRLQNRNPQAAGQQLQDAQSLTRQAMGDLRAALDDLRQESAPDLNELAHRLAEPLAAQNGWTLNLDIHVPALAPQLVSALRPVLAEALMNVARHAQAKQVWLRAHGAEGALLLSVEDDGIGMVNVADTPGHYGLRGMRERLAALAGSLELGSRQGGGTRLNLRVPLRAASSVSESSLSELAS